MVTEMLELFKQRPYWMKSEIMQHTRQSERLVNEVLHVKFIFDRFVVF